MKLYDAPHTLTFDDEQASKVKETYSPETKSILVDIDATHGGYINRNFYFYVPDGMKRSVTTWTTPFKKPWLKHHNHYSGEPLGRVQEARYMGDSAKGYHQTSVLILDADAIEKVIDGRYLTVSTNGNPAGPVRCSVCDVDLREKGWCGHMRGHYYDQDDEDVADYHNYRPAEKDGQKVLCYWIVEQLDYKEGSFVNVPADNDGQMYAGVTDWKFQDSETIDPTADFQDPNTPQAYTSFIMTDSQIWVPETGAQMRQVMETLDGFQGVPDLAMNGTLWHSILEDRQAQQQPVTADLVLPAYLEKGGQLIGDTAGPIAVSQEPPASQPKSTPLTAPMQSLADHLLADIHRAGAGPEAGNVSPEDTAEHTVTSQEELTAAFATPAAVVDGFRALSRYDGDQDPTAFRDFLTRRSTDLALIDAEALEELTTLIDLLESFATYARDVEY